MRSSAVSWSFSSSGSSQTNTAFDFGLSGAFIDLSSVHSFEDHREPLAHTDAQRHRRVAAAALLELARHGERKARTGAAERVADGDRAAVRIDARILEVDLHQLEAPQHLARESLVYLDDIHVLELQAGALERERNRVGWAHPHDARLDARRGGGQDPGHRLLAALVSPGPAADQQGRGAVVHAGGVAGG